MEERKDDFFNQAEEVKNETAETAREFRESVRNVDFKEETEKTKGFVGKMFKNPIKMIEEMALDGKKYFTTALIILGIWVVAILIRSSYSTFHYFGLVRVFSNILSVLKNILVPIVIVLVYSIILFIFNKKYKRSLTEIIPIVTATQIPVAISAVISIITLFSREFSKISLAFEMLCLTITMVLSFFGFKAILGEEDNNEFMKKFALIQIIFYAIAVVFTFLGIYIY